MTDEADLIKSYNALVKPINKVTKELSSARKASVETVSQWKRGDDPKGRPHGSPDYFTGIDKARAVMFHEGQEMPVIPHGQVPTADQQKVIDRASIEVLVDLSITDWRNLPTKSGKTPPFTRELAVEYLTQAIFAADDLAHFARNIRNFQPISVEEIEKN